MDVESPGLVEDGTRCGSGRICMSQQCVALTTPTQCIVPLLMDRSALEME